MPSYMENYTDDQKRIVTDMLATKFIARSDIKAEQRDNGSYIPRHSKFTRQDLLDHINGDRTYGHYMIKPEENGDFTTKLLAFDIDLLKLGQLPTLYSPEEGYTHFMEMPCREIWRMQKPDPLNMMQRGFMSQQLRHMATKIMRGVADHLRVPTTMAYTGSKGVHVYAFTGVIPADLARTGQKTLFDHLDCFQPKKGNNFFAHKDGGTAEDSFAQMEVETYPKQDSLSEDGFGNLLRLPLGINRHNPRHPTFFMDARGNHGSQAIMPRDTIDALTHDNPWEDS
jgi:hypothetical protein